jgi:YHS domain-containing protein
MPFPAPLPSHGWRGIMSCSNLFSMRPRLALPLIALLSTAPLLRAADPSPTSAPAPNPYPLATCPVSGEKVGEMGPPVTIDYQGKKVSFCCDSCVAKFQKDTAKYLVKLPASTKP